MRRPVQRGTSILGMLAGMMGLMGGGSKVPSHRVKKNKGTANLSDFKGRKFRSWSAPGAPGTNQRKWRKKWRNAPYSRPKANKR